MSAARHIHLVGSTRQVRKANQLQQRGAHQAMGIKPPRDHPNTPG